MYFTSRYYRKNENFTLQENSLWFLFVDKGLQWINVKQKPFRQI